VSPVTLLAELNWLPEGFIESVRAVPLNSRSSPPCDRVASPSQVMWPTRPVTLAGSGLGTLKLPRLMVRLLLRKYWKPSYRFSIRNGSVDFEYTTTSAKPPSTP
jgi:hypothetical protein